MFSTQAVHFNRILVILLEATRFERPSPADVRFLEEELRHAKRMTALTLAQIGKVVDGVGHIDPEDMFMHAMEIVDSDDADCAALRRFNHLVHTRFHGHELRPRATLRGLFVILLKVLPKLEE